ncbi:hypothetical protein DL98DRAFT_597750 [Cadophora sp. DSE1049]|nr:hypothetical protein DL98DRAFT_597750 [Cadophora sp. DSE1049]
MSRMKALLSALPSLETRPPGATCFSQFPDLPRELRNRVWSDAAFEKRTVKLIYRSHAKLDPSLGFLTIQNQSRHPAILHTTKEAREEGLRYYERVLETRRPWKATFGLSGIGEMTERYQSNVVYVNFEVDDFLFSMPAPGSPAPWSRFSSEHSFNYRKEALERISRLTIETTAPVRQELLNSVHYFAKLGKLTKMELIIKEWNLTESQESVGAVIHAVDLQKKFKLSVNQKLRRWNATQIEQVYKWKVLQDIDLDPWTSIIKEYWSQDRVSTP